MERKLSTSDPFIPRFIGSNLKNFFLGSAYNRELRDTIEIYKQAQAAYARFPLADENERSQFVVDLVQEICDRTDRFPSRPLLLAICDLVSDLLAAEGLAEFPQLPNAKTLSMQEGATLRQRLWHTLHLTENWDRLSPLWRRKVAALVRGILESLPASAFADDSIRDGKDPLPQLAIPLISFCDDGPVVLERAVGTMYDEEAVGARLFEAVRANLEQNLCAASGINYENRTESSKPIVTPTEYRAESEEDRVRVFAAGTPLLQFFFAPLQFSFPFPARFEHMHIMGGSGHGKTQLMQLLIHQDLVKAATDGRSVVVIDSQGDLIQTISHLALFSPKAEGGLADRLIIIDPNDLEYPVCLNMFDWNRERLVSYSALERERLLNSTVELYEYFFGALLGAELTQRQGVIFRYLARLMMEIPHATIQTLRELMENGERFRSHMARLPGSARSFFETRFFDRSFNETKKQILTRLWGVLSNGTLERMFSHPKNKVDLYGSINSGKIILINSAKDLLKQEGCAIFGRFFISLIAQASIERAAIAPHERRPTFVYIDEAQDYFDENVGHLLNQARKFRIGMTFAHQNLDQLAAELRSSVMASTSIKLVGGISAKDARVLADEMRCEDSVLLGAKKRRNHTEFACHVRNFTTQAVKIAVPLGFVESQPTLGRDEYQVLLDANRDLYATRFDETRLREPNSTEPAAHEGVAHRTTKAADNTTADSDPAKTETDSQARAPIAARSTEPARSVPKPAPLGRGGRQHKYLQELIKTAAQDRGYLAVIEAPVLDGAGRVDVSLSKSGFRVACEISISSPKDWELGNTEKCLAAGYDQVILVGSDERQVQTLSKFISAHLNENVRDRVLYLTPAGVISHLDSLQVAEPEQKDEIVRGYRVKVTRQPLGLDEAEERRRAIASVLARSIKGSHSDD